MKKAVVLVVVFLLGSVAGYVAAQPNRRESDDDYARQIRRLATLALVSQKHGPQAATQLLTALSDLRLAQIGDVAKRDVSTSLIAFTRLSGTHLGPGPMTPLSDVDEVAVRKRIEEFSGVLKAAAGANQASEPTATGVTPPAGAGDRAAGSRGSP